MSTLTAERLSAADCVMIVTDHKGLDWGLIKAHAATVVDTRNAIRRKV